MPHATDVINALAESVIELYKTEVIRRRGPWKNLFERAYYHR